MKLLFTSFAVDLKTYVQRSFPFSTKWYLCSVFILMTFITKHFSFKRYDHIHPKTIKLDNLAMLICYMLMDLSNNNIWNSSEWESVQKHNHCMIKVIDFSIWLNGKYNEYSFICFRHAELVQDFLFSMRIHLSLFLS